MRPLSAPTPPSRTPENRFGGHSSGTTIEETTVNRSSHEGTPVIKTVAPLPRLLDLKAAGAYLGVSYWTARTLVDAGALPTVKLPMCPRSDGRVLRRILIDRNDLDRLIEASKEVCL